MKRILNDFKNHFKDTIRTGTKGKILSQGHEDVIIRKFKDIDISKDFELRQQRYQLQSLDEKNLTKEPTYENMSLDDIENFYVDKVAEEEIEKRLDVNQEVIVSGIKKEVLLNEIILTEFLDKHFPDEKAHPKILENMQKIHYSLLHNVPISKKELFETFPQYFTEEIGSLTEDERQNFPMRK